VTNAELTILSLVAETPRHGYAIERLIEDRGMREWTEVGFSSIYYLLKKLQDRGLVESRPGKETRGPARTIFSATTQGRRELRTGVIGALSAPARSRAQFMFGLANLPTVPVSDAAQALTTHRDDLLARLGRLRTRRDEQSPLPKHVSALFDYSETLITAEVAWIDQYRGDLETTNHATQMAPRQDRPHPSGDKTPPEKTPESSPAAPDHIDPRREKGA